jgi:DNA-binding transcriptional MerR regulator
MSERIFTLFGEEVVPEQLKAVGKSRAKKAPKEAEAPQEKKTEENKEEVAVVKSKKEEAQNIGLPEDWSGNKQYYSIGEVATLFKVRTSHIRFWTNEFKLKVRTTRKGDRLYTAEQVRELRAIHHLVKERGFTLTGAKAKLKSQNKMDVETVDLKQSLLQLRNKLLIIRNQLKSTPAKKEEEPTDNEENPDKTNETTL